MRPPLGNRLVGTALLLACASLGLGCTSKRPAVPPPVEITGQVISANGQPVTGMLVLFHADDEIAAQGRVPTGLLDKDGKYTIPEVTPGKYKVSLARIPAHSGQAADATQLNAPGKGERDFAIPIEYLNSGSTPWTVTVESPPKTEKLVVNAAGFR